MVREDGHGGTRDRRMDEHAPGFLYFPTYRPRSASLMFNKEEDNADEHQEDNQVQTFSLAPGSKFRIACRHYMDIADIKSVHALLIRQRQLPFIILPVPVSKLAQQLLGII